MQYRAFPSERNLFARTQVADATASFTYSKVFTRKNMDKNETISETEAALYDRQIRLWGVEAQKRMREAKVLICGLRGTTVELCKNLVLAGISVTIQESSVVKAEDLGTQFFLREEDIGKNLAEASKARIQELNPLVEVTIMVKDLTDLGPTDISKFDYLCACATSSIKTLMSLNSMCRENSTHFFCADSFGMYGYLFLDLGESYTYIETKVESSSEGSDSESKKVQRERTLKFVPLEDALTTKWTSLPSKKRKRVPSAYFTLRTLYELQKLESPNERENIKMLLEKLLDQEELTPSQSLFDLDSVVDSAKVACKGAEINPVCAIMGGIVGQKILKAISRKDKPLQNFFFFDGVASCGTVRALPPKSFVSSA
mmetsp:Transcript_13181/g.15993  ORF Transcript_13181/g.15993 Transcript_13181/m.15993 type:complete len:372 (-) Transcript_13181:671-1786(-)